MRDTARAGTYHEMLPIGVRKVAESLHCSTLIWGSTPRRSRLGIAGKAGAAWVAAAREPGQVSRGSGPLNSLRHARIECLDIHQPVDKLSQSAFVEHPESASNRRRQMISHSFAAALPNIPGASGSNPIVNFRRIYRADVDIGSEVPAAWVRSKLSIGIAGRATGGQQRQTQSNYR